MFSVCKLCNMAETEKHTSEISYCDECYSAEQGFLHLREDDNGNIFDEDGNEYEL